MTMVVFEPAFFNYVGHVRLFFKMLAPIKLTSSFDATYIAVYLIISSFAEMKLSGRDLNKV